MNLDEVAVKFNPVQDYTLTQIKEILKEISYSSILNNITKGKLKARLVFGKYYVKGADIRDFLLGKA